MEIGRALTEEDLLAVYTVRGEGFKEIIRRSPGLPGAAEDIPALIETFRVH